MLSTDLTPLAQAEIMTAFFTNGAKNIK